MIGLLPILFIFSFIGFCMNKIFFKEEILFNIPIGFVSILCLFQIISLPFLFVHGNFMQVIYLFMSIFIPILFFLIYKNGKNYLLFLRKNIFTRTAIIYYIIVGIVSTVVILLTISEVDQMLYSSQVISTIKTNIIYYSDGTRTLDHVFSSFHTLESYSLFNAMLIKITGIEHVSYIFGLGRIVEIFIIIGSFGMISQIFFKKSILAIIFLTCGLLGLNLLSATPFSLDEYVLLFSGTTGTLYMFVLLGPLLLAFFKTNFNKTLFFSLIVIFSFSITYTFLPIMIFTTLIISIIYKNGRIFYITTLLTSLFMCFYFPKLYFIFLILAALLLIFILVKKLYSNVIILYLVYGSVIVCSIIYGGFEHILGMNGNLMYYFMIPLLYVYYKSKNCNIKIFLFISMFLLFNICFSTRFEDQTFLVMIVNTRSSIFLFTSFLLISIIDEYKIMKYILAILSIIYVILYSIIGIPNEYTRNFTEYFQDLQKYKSQRSMLIGNKDQEELIKHDFELNSDIIFYNFTGLDRMDKFDDSIVQSINKYIGVTNIYLNKQEDYCEKTDKCYVVVSKFYYNDDKKIKMLKIEDYLLETEKYYLVKLSNLHEYNDFTKYIEELYE
ncbi:MAG: hypothetical protein ACRC5R_04725 [Mycoplasmatales bacterium]